MLIKARFKQGLFISCISLITFLVNRTALSGEFQRLTLEYQCAVLFDPKYESFRKKNFVASVEANKRCCDSKEAEEKFVSTELIQQNVPPHIAAKFIGEIEPDGSFRNYYIQQVQEIKFEGSLQEIDIFLRSWHWAIRDHNLLVNKPIINETKARLNEVAELFELDRDHIVAASRAGVLMLGVGVFDLLGRYEVLSIPNYYYLFSVASMGYFVSNVYKIYSFRSKVRKQFGVGKDSLLSNYANKVHKVNLDDSFFKNTLPRKIRYAIKENDSSDRYRIYLAFKLNKLPDPDFIFVAVEDQPTSENFKLTLKLFTN